jgi:hypothetical protein
MSGKSTGGERDARDESERALAADAAVDADEGADDDMRAASAERARVFRLWLAGLSCYGIGRDSAATKKT